MTTSRLLLAAMLASASFPYALAQAPAAPAAPAAPVAKVSLAPLVAGRKAVSSHAPFEAGDCKVCHQGNDPKKPGPLVKSGTAMCLDCHEEFTAILGRKHKHRPAGRDCNACHNPHNAAFPKLLNEEPSASCVSCHDDIGKTAGEAKVKHKAVSQGAKCVACHDPHGANQDKLLVKAPFDLCLSCHNVDTMKGVDGKPLQNTKAWLDKNKEWHDPVKAKDCSACHEPHGGDHFRLLKDDYPKEFYAPYDARTYALCFSCHKEQAYSSAKTTTLTGFRDGDRNLHFVHLQQGARGRTCRACHEVHASSQKLHVRDGVPYGSSGWTLKLNFRKSDAGGSCDKTCHAEKSYSNRPAR